MILIVVAVLAVILVLSYHYPRKSRNEDMLAAATAITLPFLLLRVLYPLIVLLDPSTSDLRVKAGMSVIRNSQLSWFWEQQVS